MPSWLWFTPAAVLALACGIWAFRMGWIAATISETDVIESWTAHYLAQQAPDARATDCTGRPVQDSRVWILVSCVNSEGRRFNYPVDRFGRLLRVSPSSPPPGAPEA